MNCQPTFEAVRSVLEPMLENHNKAYRARTASVNWDVLEELMQEYAIGGYKHRPGASRSWRYPAMASEVQVYWNLAEATVSVGRRDVRGYKWVDGLVPYQANPNSEMVLLKRNRTAAWFRNQRNPYLPVDGVWVRGELPPEGRDPLLQVARLGFAVRIKGGTAILKQVPPGEGRVDAVDSAKKLQEVELEWKNRVLPVERWEDLGKVTVALLLGGE